VGERGAMQLNIHGPVVLCVWVARERLANAMARKSLPLFPFFSLSLFLLPFSSSSSSSCHLYLYLFVGKGTPHEYIYTRPKQHTHAHTQRRSETHATTPSSTALRVRLWGMKVRQRDTIICDGFRQ
jgi:hypothetical protein